MNDISVVEFYTQTWSVPGSGMDYRDPNNGLLITNPQKQVTVLSLPEFQESFLVSVGQGHRSHYLTEDHVSYFNRRLDKLLAENFYLSYNALSTDRYLLQAYSNTSSYSSWSGSIDRVSARRAIVDILLATTPRGRLERFWLLNEHKYNTNHDDTVSLIDEFYLQYRYALSQWYPFIPFTEESMRLTLSDAPGSGVGFCKHVRRLTGSGLAMAHSLYRKQRAYCVWVTCPQSVTRNVDFVDAMNFHLYPFKDPNHNKYSDAYQKEIIL